MSEALDEIPNLIGLVSYHPGLLHWDNRTKLAKLAADSLVLTAFDDPLEINHYRTLNDSDIFDTPTRNNIYRWQPIAGNQNLDKQDVSNVVHRLRRGANHFHQAYAVAPLEKPISYFLAPWAVYIHLVKLEPGSGLTNSLADRRLIGD